MTIDDGPLTGMVYGQPWTFQAGGTDAFLSEGDDNFFATFYASAFTVWRLGAERPVADRRGAEGGRQLSDEPDAQHDVRDGQR